MKRGIVYPNAVSHQHNKDFAVSALQAVSFIATHSASLPEMIPTYNGFVGHYYNYMAHDITMYDLIRNSVKVLFRGCTEFGEVETEVSADGYMVHVYRTFGQGVSITIAYVWKSDEAKEALYSGSESPAAKVHRAIRDAWDSLHLSK